MANEIRVRVLGDERAHLATIGRYLNYGDTDSEIIRTLLREKAKQLQTDQPVLVQIQRHTNAIQRILDAEAEQESDDD